MAMAPTTAHAQFGGTLFGPPSQQFAPPNPVGPPPSTAPAARAIQTAPAAPTAQNAPQLPAGQSSLAVSARFGRDIPQPVNSGLLWRVYPAKPDASRAYKPVKEERTASPVFQLPPGDYVVHVTLRPGERSESGLAPWRGGARGIRLVGRRHSPRRARR